MISLSLQAHAISLALPASSDSMELAVCLRCLPRAPLLSPYACPPAPHHLQMRCGDVEHAGGPIEFCALMLPRPCSRPDAAVGQRAFSHRERRATAGEAANAAAPQGFLVATPSALPPERDGAGGQVGRFGCMTSCSRFLHRQLRIAAAVIAPSDRTHTQAGRPLTWRPQQTIAAPAVRPAEQC